MTDSRCDACRLVIHDVLAIVLALRNAEISVRAKPRYIYRLPATRRGGHHEVDVLPGGSEAECLVIPLLAFDVCIGPYSFASGRGQLQGGGQAGGGKGVYAGRVLGKLQFWLLCKLTPLSG